MKLTCDLCGGELEAKAAGVVCRNCGIEYGEDRLREKWSEIRRPVVETQPVRDVPSRKPSAVSAKKEQKRMKTMWIILAAVGLFAFFGTLFADGGQQTLIVFVVSLAALLITLFIFKPWKVYGGESI